MTVAGPDQALTQSFRELVQERLAADPVFAAALLSEGIDLLLAGELGTGNMILRDYIKAMRSLTPVPKPRA